MRKPAAKTAAPQQQRRTLDGPAPASKTTVKTASPAPLPPSASSASARPKTAQAPVTTRRTTATKSASPKPPTGTRAASNTANNTATRKTAPSPKPGSPKKAPLLGSLYGPSPARSRLELLAADDDDNQKDQQNNNDVQGSTSRPRDSSIGRHADLDDMSPENASFKDLVEMREKQFYRVKDVLIRYNEDLQKRLDTASAVGSLGRHYDSVVDPRNPSSASPSRNRGMTIGPVSTADELKIIQELLNGKGVDGEDDEEGVVLADENNQNNSEKQAVSEENKNNIHNNTNSDENAAVAGGPTSPEPRKGPDTPRVGGVSRTALRAIVKHAQDTVNKAIDEDRERQADFEESVLSRMQNLERVLGSMQIALKDQHETRVAAEENDKTVRESEVEPIREKISDMERIQEEKGISNKEKMDVLQGQIDFVASDLQELAKDIKVHQKNLEEKTKEAAQDATKHAIDKADDRVRELCEAVERGLSLTERCRDDIPQAIITSVENVEASLHRAMQSEFDAQSLRIQVAEEQQADVNRKTKEMLEQEVAGMKQMIGETLADLRREYGEAIQQHIEEVRKKAEEYEEARRLALPVPDAERVQLMQEELESSLQLLRYLTEANSGAMASTIPLRLERSEQKTAELEASLESQQNEIDRLHRKDIVCHSVDVGPDNLKDAWLGVSSYRAVPPTSPSGGADEEQNENGQQQHQHQQEILGFDESGKPIEAYSPANTQQVHNQISEALKMIARRHSSMSPLRGSPHSSAFKKNNNIFADQQQQQEGEDEYAVTKNNNNNNFQTSAASSSGAAAGAPTNNHNSNLSSRNSNTLLYSSGSDSADTLPKNFDSLPHREQLEIVNQVTSAKRAQLVTVQKVLSNIQNAFHDLTLQEAEVMAQSSPTRLAPPSGATPRTIAEYQSNRRICDEIATRKQRMYEKERLVVEKRNRLSREIEGLQDRESEIFKALSLSSRSQ